MKNLVIIDDKPWRFKIQIKELREILGPENWIKVLFVDDNMADVEGLDDFTSEEILMVNEISFAEVVDTYFEMNDVVILMDCCMYGEKTFEEQLGVKYVLSKDECGKGRIWLYTAAGRFLKSVLVQNFPEQVVNVELSRTEEYQLCWDAQRLMNILTAK